MLGRYIVYYLYVNRYLLALRYDESKLLGLKLAYFRHTNSHNGNECLTGRHPKQIIWVRGGPRETTEQHLFYHLISVSTRYTERITWWLEQGVMMWSIEMHNIIYTYEMVHFCSKALIIGRKTFVSFIRNHFYKMIGLLKATSFEFIKMLKLVCRGSTVTRWIIFYFMRANKRCAQHNIICFVLGHFTTWPT